jgi:hypothetical protein
VLYSTARRRGKHRPVELICPNCGVRLTLGDGVYREITHFTRDRTEHDVVPAASDLQPG